MFVYVHSGLSANAIASTALKYDMFVEIQELLKYLVKIWLTAIHVLLKMFSKKKEMFQPWS